MFTKEDSQKISFEPVAFQKIQQTQHALKNNATVVPSLLHPTIQHPIAVDIKASDCHRHYKCDCARNPLSTSSSSAFTNLQPSLAEMQRILMHTQQELRKAVEEKSLQDLAFFAKSGGCNSPVKFSFFKNPAQISDNNPKPGKMPKTKAAFFS